MLPIAVTQVSLFVTNGTTASENGSRCWRCPVFPDVMALQVFIVLLVFIVLQVLIGFQIFIGPPSLKGEMQ